MTVNLEKAAGLLHIVEKCAGHNAKLMSLSNMAMKELLSMNEEAKQQAIEEAKKQAKADAEAAAKVEAKRQADIKAEEETTRRADIARQRAVDAASKPEEPDVRPSIFPGDSETASIADRRI